MKLSSTAISFILAYSASTGAAFQPASFGVTRKQSAQTNLVSALNVASKPNVGQDVISNFAPTKPASDAAQALALDNARDSIKSYLSQYDGQSGASVIYSKLVEHGVDVVNGYSGGAVLPLLDQFHEMHPRHEGLDKPPVRWITNSNESSAGHIAEGYAKSGPTRPDGKPPAGVVVATSGPGVTNLITPLQDAICDGVGMVVLCGQAATNAPQDAFQSAPAVDLTRPCTKWSYQIKNAAELPLVMDYAFFLARSGRPGPVFIDLPKDLQNQIINPDLIEEFTNAVPQMGEEAGSANGILTLAPKMSGANGDATLKHEFQLGTQEKGISFRLSVDGKTLEPVPYEANADAATSFQMDHQPTNKIYLKPKDDLTQETAHLVGSTVTGDMLGRIRKAKKPIIIAGQGCNDCPDLLKEFAELAQIPVATTLHGLGCFDERHDLALNMVGMHGHPTPNYMVQEADMIICIGSRFDDRITGAIGEFIPFAVKASEEGVGGVIHVDVRLSENAKQVKPDYFVHSTGMAFLEAMNKIMKANPFESVTQDWLERKKDLEKDFPVKVPIFPTEDITGSDKDGNAITTQRTRMSAQSAITEMDRQLCETNAIDNCIFSTGVGIHQMVAAQLVTWTQPKQMVSSGSLGTMGVALGFVIGCKLANGHKMCIAIDGDGSFNMTFTELKTVAEQKIPVKIMILDNESQMMVEYWQRLFHDERYLAVTNTVNPKYGTLADAFGIKNLYCDCAEDLPEVMRQFLFEDPDEPVLLHVRIERTPCLPLVAPGQALQNMILEDEVIGGLDAAAAPS
jgi:acetolactate synthase-1/2/3 large subunit